MKGFDSENVDILKSFIVDRLDLALCSQKQDDACFVVYVYFKGLNKTPEVYSDKIVLGILELLSLKLISDGDLEEITKNIDVNSNWKILLLKDKPMAYYMTLRMAYFKNIKLMEQYSNAKSEEKTKEPVIRKRGRPRKTYSIDYGVC